MVAVLLAAAGIAGATGVYLAARGQHARDRRAIEPWLSVAAPAITDARRAIESLADSERRLRRGDFTIEAEKARSTLERAARALAPLPTPAVLRTIASEITAGLGYGLQEGLILERAAAERVYGIDARTAYASARSSLDQTFGDGLKRLNDIRCRSGLGCEPL